MTISKGPLSAELFWQLVFLFFLQGDKVLEKFLYRPGYPCLVNHFVIKPYQVVVQFKYLLNNAVDILFGICQLFL
jgi:hypothetical protein